MYGFCEAPYVVPGVVSGVELGVEPGVAFDPNVNSSYYYYCNKRA